MLLSLFPCLQHRKMPLHREWELPSTVKCTENCKQVHPFRAGSQHMDAALSRFMPCGFLTMRIPSRSAGKPGFVPTKMKRQLLCSSVSLHLQHS